LEFLETIFWNFLQTIFEIILEAKISPHSIDDKSLIPSLSNGIISLG